MRLLGIDFGMKRVGLAVTDPEARLAFPLKTVYKTTRDKLFSELLEVIATEAVEAIVLGLPSGPESRQGVDADAGEEQLIVRQIRNFAESLKRRTELPIYFVDESYSSLEAEQRLHEAGVRGKRFKATLDQHAAVLILETFIKTRLRKTTPTDSDA